jgi:hypothetical protein
MASLCATLAMLLHARLLGRLGYLLNQAAPEASETDSDEEEAEPQPPAEPVAEVPVQPMGETYRISQADEPQLPRADYVPRRGEDELPAMPRPLPPLLDSTLLVFLGQLSTWGVILWLTVGGGVLAALVRVEIMLWPQLK